MKQTKWVISIMETMPNITKLAELKCLEVYGTFMPVLHLECRYVRPARYDDLLTIETTLRKLPSKDIIFNMEIRNEAGKIVNGGRVRLCFLDRHTEKAVNAPAVLLEVLKPFF